MSELEVLDWSYKVLEELAVSMRKVKARPDLFGRFLYEYLTKLPEVVDAVMPLVKEEHQGVVGDVLKASGEMAGECLAWLAK